MMSLLRDVPDLTERAAKMEDRHRQVGTLLDAAQLGVLMTGIRRAVIDDLTRAGLQSVVPLIDAHLVPPRDRLSRLEETGRSNALDGPASGLGNDEVEISFRMIERDQSGDLKIKELRASSQGAKPVEKPKVEDERSLTPPQLTPILDPSVYPSAGPSVPPADGEVVGEDTEETALLRRLAELQALKEQNSNGNGNGNGHHNGDGGAA